MACGEMLLVITLFGVFVFALASLLVARRKVDNALSQIAALRERVQQLEGRLRTLAVGPEPPGTVEPPEPPRADLEAPIPVPPGEVTPALPPPAPVAPPLPSPEPVGPAAPPLPAFAPAPPLAAAGAAPAFQGAPAVPAAPVPMVETALAAPTAAAAPEPAGAAEHGAAGTIETEIGAHWLLYVGISALVLGIGFFVKHAFDNQWITPAARVLAGGVIGLALVVAGARFVRRGYALYGQILTGGGIATLYLSAYAAFDFYGLVSRPAAFVMMVTITASAAVLANRQRSQGLALVAVSGGFLTPFLVGGDVDQQAALFTYDAVLVAATMYLAHQRRWPLLNLLGFIATVLTITAWADAYYTPERALPTQLFLTLFCAMFLYILRENARSGHPLAPVVTVVLAAAPIAYHAASIVLLFDRSEALLTYLILATAVGLVGALHYRSPALRLLLWAVVFWPFAGWLGGHTAREWMWPSSVTLAALYGLHLAVQWRETRGLDRNLPATEVVLFHLNGLMLFIGAYTIVRANAPAWDGGLAAALAAWNGLPALAWRRRAGDAWLQPLALAFALSAIAVAIEFDGLWVTVGWAAEGAAVIWVGLKARRDWLRAGGAVLLGIAIARFLAVDEAGIRAAFTPVLNARVATGLFLIALLYVIAFLHRRVGTDGADRPRPEIATSIVAANILTWLIATIEINAWFANVPRVEGRLLARQLWLAGLWTLHGAVLYALGALRPCLAVGRGVARAAGAALMALGIAGYLTADLLGQAPDAAAFLNARFGVGALFVAVIYVLAALRRRSADAWGTHEVNALVVAANLLTLVVLTLEADAFWRLREVGRDAYLVRQMTISVIWAVYGAILIAVGIGRLYAPLRYVALGLFALTIGKVFLVDLSQLAGIYRVAGFVVLGSVLLVAAYLYQRYRARLG